MVRKGHFCRWMAASFCRIKHCPACGCHESLVNNVSEFAVAHDGVESEKHFSQSADHRKPAAYNYHRIQFVANQSESSALINLSNQKDLDSKGLKGSAPKFQALAQAVSQELHHTSQPCVNVWACARVASRESLCSDRASVSWSSQ